MLLAFALTLVALASWLVTSNSESEAPSYLVAATNLSSSDEITSAKVNIVSLELGELSASYLKLGSNQKWFLTRPIAAGELIPLSALANTKFLGCNSLIVSLGAEMAANIRVGNSLDLWSADPATSIESIPFQIVIGAELIAIKSQTQDFSQSSQSIEVCVSPAEIRSVVEAISSKATIIAIRNQD